MVLSDTSNGDIGWKKWLIASWAFIECVLFGGLLFGWASLNYVLNIEGIYGCEQISIKKTETTVLSHTQDWLHATGSNATSEEIDLTCIQQEKNMALCFTIASTLFSVGCAVFGHIGYRFGTRVARITSFFLFIIGSIMMAFVSTDNPWLIYPGFSCLSIGGFPILVTNTQVSNLFLVGSSTIVGLLCGGFDMSSVVMLCIKLAYQNGFSLRSMFIFLAALHGIVLVSTFFFLPKGHIVRPSNDIGDRIEVPSESETGAVHQICNEPNLKCCLLDPKFISHTIWLCILELRFFYFLGTLNQYLTRILIHQDQVSYFLDVCIYTMLGGMLTSLLTGIVYDWQKSMFKGSQSREYRDVMPAVLPLATTNTLSLLLSIFVLIPVKELLYVTFVVMTVKRSFLYSMAAAFLNTIFPGEYFDMLYGVMILCGGIFSSLQYAFFTWAVSYKAAPQHVDIFLLLLVLLSYIHPLYLWCSSRKNEREL